MGWTLATFHNLPEREQIEWLARDAFRQEALETLTDRMGQLRDKKPPREDGKMHNLTPEVAAMITIAKI